MGDRDNNRKKQDDLLRRAERLLQKADDIETHGHRQSPPSEPAVGIRAWLSGMARILRTIGRWLGPIGRVIGWVLKKAFALFQWAAYQREKGKLVRNRSGNPVFSGRRLALVSAGLLLGFVLLHMGLSAVYYYSTKFEETVYVTGKQEIETGELYQFGGCTSLPCRTESDNGKFYLIETSMYFPRLYFPEEDVFANIPQQDAACNVRGYGLYFRSMRWLYKSAQLYQHVTDVSCRPFSEEEVARAVQGEVIQFETEPDG